MTVLGFQCGAEVNSASLAESVNAEPTFVRKSLSKLAKAGLVKTTRGKNGACTLARAPAEITLRDIYRASEAPTAFALHDYPVEQTCAISSNINVCMASIQAEAQHGLEEALAKTTLADLVAGVRERACQAEAAHAARGAD
jgi:Rrf2 family protein